MKSEEQRQIEEQIRQNPLEGQLYYELGKCLEETNIKQAYLCYENALFLSKENDNIFQINQAFNHVVAKGGRVNKAAIVILSYNLRQDTQNCIESIRETTPESAREIIVVDNNSKDDSVDYLRQQNDIVLIENDFNAGFPGGCNIGIKAAQNDSDIFLLNNDVIVCANSLFWLRMGLYESDGYGAAGCVCNIWYNWQNVCENGKTVEWYKEFAIKHNVPMDNCLEYKTYLIGYALLLKRNVLNEIGLLDERFFPGNYEDNDLGLRILEAGYANILVNNSFLIHWCSKSFNKEETFSETLLTNRSRFNQKYGEGTHYLMSTDFSVTSVFQNIGKISSNANVLQLHCGIGIELFRMKKLYPDVNFIGVDTDERTARFGLHQPDCMVKKYENIMELPFEEHSFDIIYANSKLITTENVESYLESAKKYLKSNGRLLLIVENARYYANWMSILVDGDFSNILPRETLTSTIAEKVILEHGGMIERWLFFYRNETKYIQGKEEIVSRLPECFRKEAEISSFGLIIAFS